VCDILDPCWLKEVVEARTGIPCDEQVWDTTKLSEEQTVISARVGLRVQGGKGGFGALLRGAGAKASAKLKSISNEDCRDLSGRRIRHVKNEQRLAEWYAQQKQTEQEETNKKQKKKKTQQEPTFHVVEDKKFTNQIKEIEESITNSVEIGLQEAKRLKSQPPPPEDHQVKKKPKIFWDEFESDSEDTTTTTTTTTKKQADLSPQQSTQTTSEATDNLPTGLELSSEEQQAVTPTKHEAVSNEIDLSAYTSAQELESVGLDALKEELQRRGLLCGGTLKDRASRLFSVKGLSQEEIPDSIKAKNTKKRKK
jgi:hypothetical protein